MIQDIFVENLEGVTVSLPIFKNLAQELWWSPFMHAWIEIRPQQY